MGDGFDEYVQGIVSTAHDALSAATNAAREIRTDLGNCGDYDISATPPFVLKLSDHESGWLDTKNVCNKYRAQALVHELARRGFDVAIDSVDGLCPFNEPHERLKLTLSYRAGCVGNERVQRVLIDGLQVLQGALPV